MISYKSETHGTIIIEGKFVEPSNRDSLKTRLKSIPINTTLTIDIHKARVDSWVYDQIVNCTMDVLENGCNKVTIITTQGPMFKREFHGKLNVDVVEIQNH
jgi:hypothetical protein